MTSKHVRVFAWSAGVIAAWACYWFGNGATLAQPLLAPPDSLLPAASTPTAAGEASTLSSPHVAIARQPSHEILPFPADPEDPPVDPTAPMLLDDSAGSELAEPQGWRVPIVWLGPTPWETSIEFGLNGSTGTSESLSIHAGGHVLRESKFSKLDLDATYHRTTEGGAATQNDSQFDVRND